MDSEESEESCSINSSLCDECCNRIVFDDSDDKFYEGTNNDNEPTLRHSGTDIDLILLQPTRCWRDTLPDLPMMAGSAAGGCHMCGFLREELIRQDICYVGNIKIDAGYRFGGEEYELGIGDRDPGLALWTCEVYAIETATDDTDEFQRIITLTFDIESSDSDLLQWLRVHRKAAPKPLDPASVEWLQLQLRNCDNDCGHGKPELSFLPTRLIHVGQNEDDLPRLVIVKDMLHSCTIDNLEYATLSYCWGPKEDALKQTKTTKDTILTHLQGIPLSSLSPIIRDTIKVCRALGVMYLWVDALCIIQGDNMDWDRESQMVGQIYHSCYVAICSLSSRSCLEGYLGPRSLGLEVEFQSSRHEHIRGTYRFVLSSTYIDTDDSGWVDERPTVIKDIEGSSWDHRGWTFQESILSPRMIYFGPNLSHFVCENLTTSENGYFGQDIGATPDSLPIDIRRALGKPYHERNRSSNNMADTYCNWTVVNQLSERAWTFREDIFPGLAGIAQVFEAITGDIYLAGLWKSDLHHQLLWYIPQPPASELASFVHSLQHADPYIAPSWSWASQEPYQQDLIVRVIGRSSVDKAVKSKSGVESFTTEHSHTRPDFSLTDYRIDLRGSNRFGALTGGFLRLRGRACPFPSAVRRELKPHKGCRSMYGQFSGGIGTCMLDWGVSQTLVQAPESMRLILVTSCCSPTVSWGNLARDAGYDEEDFDDWVPSDAEVGGMSFPNGYEEIETCRYCADPMHKRTGWGLVIHPAEEPGSYVRVGVFVMFAHKGGMDLFKGEAEEIKLI